MLAIKWACAMVVLGLLGATPTLAGHTSVVSVVRVTDDKSAQDHHSLAMYYADQAQLDRRKAEEWEFLANHHANFPKTIGTSNEDEYIARCRTMAEDFRNLEKWHHKLALKHIALMRKDVIP